MALTRFEKRVHYKGMEVDVSILDTAGQEAFLPLRSNWIIGRDAFVLAFSVENPNLDELLEYEESINSYLHDKKNIPIALVATKSDLLKRPSSYEALEKCKLIAQEKGWGFHVTSAKEDIGIDELFESLVYQHFGWNYTNSSSIKELRQLKHGASNILSMKQSSPSPSPTGSSKVFFNQDPKKPFNSKEGFMMVPMPVPEEREQPRGFRGLLSRFTKLCC